MKGKTIGLDIGATSIRVAMLKQDGKSISLDSVASIPQTSKGMISDSQADLQQVADLIKQLLESTGISLKDVAVSIPDGQTYTKIIEMPQLSEQELRAALRFEMEQYVPLPLNQVKTDYEILGKREVGEKKVMDLMIVAAPIAILEKYQKVLELAGLSSNAIENEIVSVHRALLPQLNTQGSSLIVHIGASSTTIAAVRQGRLSMIFSSNVGGYAMTRTISVDLGIDIGQAENYKKAYGLSGEFEGKIGKALEGVLSQIATDLKRTILSYREKNDNQNIDQIILSGGSSLLPGLDVYLTNATSAQVVLGNSWTAYGIGNVPAELAVQAPTYNVVMGLALRNFL